MAKLNDKIYLDQKGYEQFLEEIDELRGKLRNNGRAKSEAYSSAVGDGWHDNFDFEEAKREELRIMGELKESLEKLSKIVIIDEVINENMVNINDIITVKIEFDEDEIEEMSFKLVGLNRPNLNSEIKEISINSPLGKSVYCKKVGDVGSYDADGNAISYIITDVLKYENNNEIQQEEQTSIRRGK